MNENCYTWDLIDNLFDCDFNCSKPIWWNKTALFMKTPKKGVKCYDKEKGILTFLVPGYNKTNIKIWIEKDKLYIEGKKKGFTSINENIYVGENLDNELTEAVVENGILTISLKYKDDIDNKKFITIK